MPEAESEFQLEGTICHYDEDYFVQSFIGGTNVGQWIQKHSENGAKVKITLETVIE